MTKALRFVRSALKVLARGDATVSQMSSPGFTHGAASVYVFYMRRSGLVRVVGKVPSKGSGRPALIYALTARGKIAAESAAPDRMVYWGRKPKPINHGRYGYNYLGCRCGVCVAANNEYGREYLPNWRKKRKG